MVTNELFGGFFGFFMVFPLAFLAVIALAIVAVATGRSEPDPDGRRSYGFYLSTIGLVTILVVLFAGAGSISSVIAAGVEKDDPFSTSESFFDEGSESGVDFEVTENFDAFDPDDRRYATAVRAGIVALAAFAVYAFHRRRLRQLHDESVGREGAAWRVYYGYLLAVALVGVIVLLVAASDSLYGVFRTIAPGVTGFATDDGVERRAGLSQFLGSGVLAAGGAFVFQAHWRWSREIATPMAPAPPAPAVPPPPPAVAPPAE